MAKHAHRIMLLNKKTWKCMLEGCNFFVHQGLAHLLLGKTGICWECGEQFMIDEYALKDEQPKCYDCRSDVIVKPVNVVTEIPEEGMSEEKKKLYKQLGILK